ncbi:MAG: hypothetical protein ACREQL_10295, partial [Candidatus Binatia bacterium]
AEALYTSLVDLDDKAGGNLLTSQLHFIGHSRGTVVNSEIVQRLGKWNPSVTNIQMTTLDPHDFKQDSLKINLGTLLGHIDTALTVAAGAATFGFPPALPVLLAAKKYLGLITTVADKLGVALDIPYDDFKDPEVKRWANVGFLDNYFQTTAKGTISIGPVIGPTLSANVTLTPNGRSITGADIDYFLGGPPTGTGQAGFTQDDYRLNVPIGPLLGFSADFGLRGPHSRVWQWYAGTVDTDMLEFQDFPIYRRIVDEGLIARTVAGLPAAFRFNDRPWYWSLPNGAPNYFTPAEPWNQPDAIWEGVTNGWYFSVPGGGAANRPLSGATGVPIDTDNTAVSTGPEAVPTVFNGDFENGTRQSLLNRVSFLGLDKGRFPLSYELPGWSFHGGQGFAVTVPGVGSLDIGGLFVFETDVTTIGTQVLNAVVEKIWGTIADATIDALSNKAKRDTFGFPTPPDSSSSPGYTSWYNANWGDGTDNKLRMDAADKLWKIADGKINELVQAGLGAANLADMIKIDPATGATNPIGVAAFKDYVKAGLQQLIKNVIPPGKSNYALLMGAGAVIKDILAVNAAAAEAPALLNAVINQVLNLDSVRHNRVHVPTDLPVLSFNVLT